MIRSNLTAKLGGGRSGAILALVLFFIDRLVKNVVWFAAHGDMRLFSEYLKPVVNANIAFSLQGPAALMRLLIPAITLAVVALIAYCARLLRRSDPDLLWWSLVAAGALSNLLDRFTLGGVLDYIDLKVWPVFNLSDAYITAGIAALIVKELFFRRSNHGSEVSQTNTR